MKWRKLGLIYRPALRPPSFVKCAMLPTPVRIADDHIRFLVARCDENGIGRAAEVTLAPERTSGAVIEESVEPLLDIGRPGMFDDNGVVPCAFVRLPSGSEIMYYVGFELCEKVRYRLFTGAAVREASSGPFQRVQETPLLDRKPKESYFRCGPFVLQDGDLYRMWYVAGDQWQEVDGRSKPVYDIRCMESTNPLVWSGDSTVCLRLGEDDHGFGRPWIVRKGSRYQMYFSRRSLKCGGAYRLGYAESDDGVSWERMDEKLNLDVSSTGWDSEAIMYSAVIEYQNRTWCFYNGNQFGREGFGVAVQEEP